MSSIDPSQSGSRFFEWVNRRIRRFVVLSLVIAVALAVVGVAKRVSEESPEDPSFAPSGEVFDTADRVEELFDVDPDVLTASYIVDVPGAAGADVLTRDALAEWVTNAAALRADSASAGHLTTAFDRDLGVAVDGIYSIGQAVDAHLPGGLANAGDADVKVALHELLADGAPTAGLRTTLSQQATATPGTVAGRDISVWTSPAFRADVVYLRESFEITDPDSTNKDYIDRQYTIEAEEWLRDAQSILQGDQVHMSALGIGIDRLLTDEEQAAETAPFIILTIVLIMFLVGALLRSYWASVVVASGLAVTFIAYLGVIPLVGIKASLLINFIVPIAVISFGVDFFIHAVGRCREEQAAGLPRDRAYPVAMSALVGALLLAVTSSALAFLSNATSGIEAITQFGIAAAIGLLLAYVFLGLLAPRLLLAIEEGLGDPPAHRGLYLRAKLGFVVMSLVAGLIVTMVILQPPPGVIGFLVVFLPLFVFVPYRRSKKRNMKAAETGAELNGAVRGGGHGIRSAGSAVHFLARWRVVTVPTVVILAGVGVYGAAQVEAGFEPSDFIASDTDLVRGADKLQAHFGASTGGSGYLLVEGDLTDVDIVAAMQSVLDQLDAADAGSDVGFLARDFDGEPVTGPSALDIVQAATGSLAARSAIESASGVTVTDLDSDGIADTPEQISAIYSQAVSVGIEGDSGEIVLTADEARQVLHVSGDAQATLLEIGIPTLTDATIIGAAEDALREAGTDFSSATGGRATARVSGDSITERQALDGFTRAMLVSLPVAFFLCAAAAWLFMRSLRYALVAVSPILLVVAWIWGFMFAFDYKINPVTATIAAIAIGVGVDYAMHFTMRFREEFVDEPSRFPALRRAGEGTGGALVISALTSIGGFLVMALSPMPIFASFGLLTAVMILFSLVVSLLVLPSLLLLVTPSRRGDTRRFLEESITGGLTEYKPHARETAFREVAS